MHNRRAPIHLLRVYLSLALALVGLAAIPARAAAAERLCDPSFEDCRSPLIDLIRNETVGIDVAFWFMEDSRYSSEIIRRWQAGVPVRIIVDPRANATYPLNADRLNDFQTAGIPMRKRIASGILHWKMMLFDGQGVMEFSGANYSPWAFVPVTPYVNYTDEAIYFSDDPSVVNSFRTKYDSLWTNTTNYADYANITGPLTARYPVYTKDPELNFPPEESYRTRAVKLYDAETTEIQVQMFRITDRAHSDAMIRAVSRGVPVRLLSDPTEYRNTARYWDAWNVDRMYAAGVQIRMSAHQGVNHEKAVVLEGQGVTIFGSSNWTSPSSDSQQEHNYFTTKSSFLTWFNAQFDRKWNNTTGNVETVEFVPLPPDTPQYLAPSNQATGMATSGIVLKWLGGFWAHNYDIYFGTSSNPPLYAADQMLGPSTSSTDYKTFSLPSLNPGTTYYWKIVSKTMANVTAEGDVWSFTTGGTPLPPPPTGATGEGDIVLYAGQATTLAGTATIVADATAAGGSRLEFPDHGAAKVSTALASPANYFEMSFDAQAGIPYHLWIRGRAQGDSWANDSVHVQFSGSVDSSGAPTWRIGTTSSTVMNLEDCSGCGLSGWGWQDNGWGVGVMGPDVYFATTGTQTIRIQVREDGLSIDQILLSPGMYLTSSPGALKNDTTILPSSSSGSTGTGGGGTTEGGAEIVLWAGTATTYAGSWAPAADASAAGGMLMRNPDAGAAKITTPLAAPGSYFELTFNAEAGKPYRIWIRGRAQNNSWANDSIWAQFSGTVDASGIPTYRIGTTSGTDINLEDCSGCGLSGWGWQDNGWGVGVLGPTLYFETTGPQTIRIQTREDGLSIDQIVISSSQYLNSSPGALKNDTTILAER